MTHWLSVSLHFIHQFTVNSSNSVPPNLRCGRCMVRSVLEITMSVFMGRCSKLFRLWASAILAAGFIGAGQTKAETVTVNVDQAQIMHLPDKVATIVIGNPLIADATLQSGGILIVTGKGYGATNLVALDRAGRVLLNNVVHVVRAGGDDLVTVYKGIDRESYSCAPDCERRITLGDSPGYFNATLTQSGARNGQGASAR